MTEIYFSSGTILGYALTGAVCIFVPFLLAFLWRRYTGESWLIFIVGVVTYYIVGTVRIMARMLMFGEDSFLRSDKLIYCFSQALLSGVLEETARYVVFRYPLKNRTARTVSVMYGLGHDAFESFAVGGIMSLEYVSYALTCNSKGIGVFLAGLNEEEAADMLESFATLADHSFMNSLLVDADMISGTLFHVAMSVIVFMAVRTEDWKRWLLLAIGIHTLMDLRQYLVVLGLGMDGARAVNIVLTGFICWYCCRLYKKLPYV